MVPVDSIPKCGVYILTSFLGVVQDNLNLHLPVKYKPLCVQTELGPKKDGFMLQDFI